MPDEQLRDTVVARLSGHPAVRFATVAAHAQAIGRRGLAALLLEYESCAAEQASARFWGSGISTLPLPAVLSDCVRRDLPGYYWAS